MYTGADITVDGDVVTKVHRLGTDPVALGARLQAATRLGRTPPGLLVPPLDPSPQRVPGAVERWSTRWPRVDVVAQDPDRAPWGAAGALLARLHRVPADALPAHGGPARLRRTLDRLADQAGVDVVRSAVRTLQLGTRNRPVTVVHGDFHLGQLGRMAGEKHWRLIDIDDLGLGDPAWDLARPAGFWAAGLLSDDDWAGFLDGYRAAGGPAVGPDDPWPALEPVARAAVVQAAAAGVVAGIDDDAQRALLAACARMSG